MIQTWIASNVHSHYYVEARSTKKVFIFQRFILKLVNDDAVYSLVFTVFTVYSLQFSVYSVYMDQILKYWIAIHEPTCRLFKVQK